MIKYHLIHECNYNLFCHEVNMNNHNNQDCWKTTAHVMQTWINSIKKN